MLISEQEYHTPRLLDGACSLGKKGFWSYRFFAELLDILEGRKIFCIFDLDKSAMRKPQAERYVAVSCAEALSDDR